jgi:hypothetical protein
MPALRTERTHRWGSSDSTLSAASGSNRPRRSISFNRDASLASSLTALSPSPPPQSKKKLEAITIRGQKLQPTPVLDTLYHWLTERKAIDDRRRAGVPTPYVLILYHDNISYIKSSLLLIRWTKDAVLLKHKFCNSYRVLDRTSQV